MEKKRILFVINPVAGGIHKAKFVKAANRSLASFFEPHFVYTEKADQASSLAKWGVEQGFEYIVAVGGDGTINEIGRNLLYTGVAMGIVPQGSGNGLARSLNIPLNMDRAIQRINCLEIRSMDSGTVNGQAFFNMSGIGFDANISARFARRSKRGVAGYVKIVLSEILRYKSRVYTLQIDGGDVLTRRAFMVSVANSAQYGNGAYIAPDASLYDGWLDVCVVKPFSAFLFPKMIYHLFSKTANQTHYVEIFKGKNILIKLGTTENIHLDGDVYNLGERLEIAVLPQSLKIIC